MFVYSEYNYLENNKETQKISNDTIKSFNNTVVDYRDAPTATIVTERNTMVSVSNSCNSGTYDNFDTNSSVFYYDAINNKSKVSNLIENPDLVKSYYINKSGVKFNEKEFDVDDYELNYDDNSNQLLIGVQKGIYEQNNNTYYAVRFIGKIKIGEDILSLSDIESISFDFTIKNQNKETLKSINKEITEVYNEVYTNGSVVCESLDNTRYFYAIIN